jgi:uncharacterized protein YifN (PemK superfamily)
MASNYLLTPPPPPKKCSPLTFHGNNNLRFVPAHYNKNIDRNNIKNTNNIKKISWVRSALFWDITRRRMVIVYRRFGATYQPHLHESRVRVGKKESQQLITHIHGKCSRDSNH